MFALSRRFSVLEKQMKYICIYTYIYIYINIYIYICLLNIHIHIYICLVEDIFNLFSFFMQLFTRATKAVR